MKQDDPRGDAAIDDSEEDRLLDASLIALVRSVEAPQPRSGFVARTLKAVRRAPLPPGRHALHHPLSTAVGWAALIAGVAGAAFGIAVSLPFIAWAFAVLLAAGIRIGVWLIQFAGTGLALSTVFTTTGLAIARAAATTEGSAGLMLVALAGALSLSALRRLLFSEEEASQWQEVS
jgi:hypothetical protein